MHFFSLDATESGQKIGADIAHLQVISASQECLCLARAGPVIDPAGISTGILVWFAQLPQKSDCRTETGRL